MKRALTVLIALMLLVGFVSPAFASSYDGYEDFLICIRRYIAAWIAWYEAQTEEEKPVPTEVTKPVK